MASEITVSGEEHQRAPIHPAGRGARGRAGADRHPASGEGKANQYFLRGYNLDHGTDLAITVDDMPVNMRTHAHGQGYADLNWLIPETVGAMECRKGPYFADEGDFASVGSAAHRPDRHVLERRSRRSPPAASAIGGTLGMDSAKVGDGIAARCRRDRHLQRPVGQSRRHAQAQRRRALQPGHRDDGFSVTGMAYANKWNSTDQMPQRAITGGLIGPLRLGRSERRRQHQPLSLCRPLSRRPTTAGSWRANAYVVKSQLDLFNNFTYFLSDPVQRRPIPPARRPAAWWAPSLAHASTARWRACRCRPRSASQIAL